MSNICPVCGFDDMSEAISYEVFRNNWIENNCEWFNEDKKPQNWDYRDQLKNIQSI